MIFGTFGGLWLFYGLMVTLGIALGFGCDRVPAWLQAYNRSPAALVVAANAPLGILGKICSVVLAFGNVAAAGAGNYSQALALQNVAEVYSRVPRAVWTSLAGSIVLACAVAGKSSLAIYLQSFVSIVGCSASVWLAIFAVEHTLFTKGNYPWSDWNEKGSMPAGVAAAAALCIGSALAMLSMAQPWFVGPIARLFSSEGVNVCVSAHESYTYDTKCKAAGNSHRPGGRGSPFCLVPLCGASSPAMEGERLDLVSFVPPTCAASP